MRCVNCRQETCILVGTCFHCGNQVNVVNPYYKSQAMVTNTDSRARDKTTYVGRKKFSWDVFHCDNQVNILDPNYISQSQTLETNTDNRMYTRTRANKTYIGRVK